MKILKKRVIMSWIAFGMWMTIALAAFAYFVVPVVVKSLEKPVQPPLALPYAPPPIHELE